LVELLTKENIPTDALKDDPNTGTAPNAMREVPGSWSPKVSII
jgi:hypothetical protein